MSSLKLTANIGLNNIIVVKSTVIIIFSEQKFVHAYNLQTSTKVSVGLFTTEIYANWVWKENLERCVKSGERGHAL